ncbi:MAG: site-specific integrase [Oscillospiraceae bacterium]|jgi:integrase|nr:site-specific integrase [Oscillospiraceae bacterium]
MGLCKDGYWRETETYEGKKLIGSGKSQKEALKALAKKVEDAKNGKTMLNSNTTVKSWAETWLDTYVKHTDLTNMSYKNIEYKVKKAVVSNIGSMKLKDVREVHLQNILNDQEGMSSSHVTKLRQYMKRMFGKAVKSRLIPYNPADDLELPKAKDNPRRSITPIEREAILEVAKTHEGGLWIKMMLYCGHRPGETIPLRWWDIDLKKKTINIHLAYESGSKGVFKEPKSEAGYRTVPIPDHLIPDFEAAKGRPEEFVFTQRRPENKGKPHTASSLGSLWKSFKRELDIQLGAKVYRNQIVESKVADDLVPYLMRHTFCTDLELAGVPINVAKYLMGHADISTTGNIYTHKSDDIIRMAAAMINDYAAKREAYENRLAQN